MSNNIQFNIPELGIYHKGIKGMKWGYNKGKRNGGRTAQEELQSAKARLAALEAQKKTAKTQYSGQRKVGNAQISSNEKEHQKSREDTYTNAVNEYKKVFPTINESRVGEAYVIDKESRDKNASKYGQDASRNLMREQNSQIDNLKFNQKVLTRKYVNKQKTLSTNAAKTKGKISQLQSSIGENKLSSVANKSKEVLDFLESLFRKK